MRAGDAGVEPIGVETGRGGKRQHIAAIHIHHHAGGAFALQALGGILLELGINGQPDIFSGNARLMAQFADDAAIGVDLDLRSTRFAAHILVEGLFDAALADAKTRLAEQRITIALHVFGRDGGDIAEQVRHAGAIGIIARLTDIGLHPRQVGQMQVDAREFLPGQILGHRHGNEFLVLGDYLRDAFFLRIADLDHLGEGVERAGDAFGGLFRHQQHAIVALVVGQFGAETVKDTAARRRDQSFGNAVVFGLGLVLIAVADLQLIQPPRQHGEHQRHAAAQAHAAARESGVTAFVLFIEQRHQKSLRNGPTSRRCSEPITKAPGI